MVHLVLCCRREVLNAKSDKNLETSEERKRWFISALKHDATLGKADAEHANFESNPCLSLVFSANNVSHLLEWSSEDRQHSQYEVSGRNQLVWMPDLPLNDLVLNAGRTGKFTQTLTFKLEHHGPLLTTSVTLA